MYGSSLSKRRPTEIWFSILHTSARFRRWSAGTTPWMMSNVSGALGRRVSEASRHLNWSRDSHRCRLNETVVDEVSDDSERVLLRVVRELRSQRAEHLAADVANAEWDPWRGSVHGLEEVARRVLDRNEV